MQLDGDDRRCLEALEALHDHLEWSVHLYLVGRPEEQPTQRPATGADYLRQKSRALADRQEQWTVVADALRQVWQTTQGPAAAAEGWA